MPEGVVILSEWNGLTIGAGILLIVGLILFISCSLSAIFNDRYIDSNTLAILVCVAVAGLGMAIGSLFMPRTQGYKIILNDNAKFDEVISHFDIVDTDGLILKVRER